MKVKFGEKEYDVREVSFEPSKESWCEYILAGGGVLKLRLVLLKVYELLDEKGNVLRQPNGDPVLMINHQTIATTEGR